MSSLEMLSRQAPDVHACSRTQIHARTQSFGLGAADREADKQNLGRKNKNIMTQTIAEPCTDTHRDHGEWEVEKLRAKKI